MTANPSRSTDAQPNGPHLDTDVTFTYCTVQPNRWTFSAAKIRAWVEQYLDGRVLNACAGPTKLEHSPVHRNDIDPEIDADTHVDVRALPDHLDQEFDIVVYDPPFTSHQAATTYDQSAPGYGRDVLDALDAVLAPGGRVIMFGYSTWGMPAARGYRHEAVGLFNTLGRQHDYLGVVDRHEPPGASEPSADAPTALTTTVETNAAAPADHGYTEQPEETVEATYRVADQGDGYLARPAVREWVESHLEGRSLVLYADGASPSHEPVLVNAPPNVATDSVDVETTVAPTTLTDAFSQVFETVVFNPPTTAFQATTEYEGTTTGLSTAIKREVHDVLEPGGRVIQLGHTASCMRADFGYDRDAVAVLTVPGDANDIVGAVDRKRTTDLTALDQTVGVVHKRCRECFAAWTTLDPVFRVPCPTCGANAAHKIGPRLHGGEHCLEPDGTVPNPGTPLEGMHRTRIHHAQDRLDAFPPCPVATSGVHERETDHPVVFQTTLREG